MHNQYWANEEKSEAGGGWKYSPDSNGYAIGSDDLKRWQNSI